MATTKTKTEETIEIRPLKKSIAKIRIVGDSPLLVHAWSEKAKREMLEAQMQTKPKAKKKEAKNPFEDFVDSMYWITEKPKAKTAEELEVKYDEALQNGAKFGFPVSAIKQAANSAAYRNGWVKNQMELRGAYFLRSDVNGLAEIISDDDPEMCAHMVRINMGKADIRYRGRFHNWHMDLMIEYNENGSISLEDIINCINAGGYSVGIGEWRPERDGDHGRFHVEVC